MNDHRQTGLLAIDVGSSRLKCGWFAPQGECTEKSHASQLPIAASPLPEPSATLALDHRRRRVEDWSDELRAWLDDWLAGEFPPCVTASVHIEAGEAVRQVLTNSGAVRCEELRRQRLPLAVNVLEPDRVGIDRLLNAVAVNRLGGVQRPTIVIDAGTAITVDVVADGVFEGGAISPGLSISLAALHGGTSSLPKLSAENLNERPDPVGKSTEMAISAGVFWSFVGGVRQLIELQAASLDQRPNIVVTGGGSEPLVSALNAHGDAARRVPHLTLAGIAVALQEPAAT